MAFVIDDVKDDPDFVEFLKSQTTAAVETATSELQSKVSELIGEKRKMSEILKKFDGLDVDEARKAMKFLESDETARLIAEGKTDEAISKHTEKLRATFDEKIQELESERDSFKGAATAAEQRFADLMVGNELRKVAAKAGILPEAIDDVIARARSIFSYNQEEGAVEALDKDGGLVKVDGKLLTMDTWVTTLPKHYWGTSQGAGIGDGGPAGKIEAQLAEAAAAGDQERYRELRRKQRGK